MTTLYLRSPTLVRSVFYGACIAAAALCHVGISSSTGLAWAVYPMMVLLGPLAVFIDMKMPLNATKRMHDAETVVRMLLLAWLYAMVLPIMGSTSPGSEQPALMYIASLAIAAIMYGVVFIEARKGLFSMIPTRMDDIFVLWILLLLPVGVLLRVFGYFPQWGFLCLAGVVILLTSVWRSNLWNNPSRSMSQAQHAHAWKRMAQQETLEKFWENVAQYYQEHLESIPTTGFSALQLPTLLSYFDNKPAFVFYPYTAPALLEADLKTAIALKEPRAQPAFDFVETELMSMQEAVAWIANLDAEKTPLDIVELPAL